MLLYQLQQLTFKIIVLCVCFCNIHYVLYELINSLSFVLAECFTNEKLGKGQDRALGPYGRHGQIVSYLLFRALAIITPPSQATGVSLQTKLSPSLDPRLQPLLQDSPYPTSLSDWCGIKKALPPCFSSDQLSVAILTSELPVESD